MRKRNEYAETTHLLYDAAFDCVPLGVLVNLQTVFENCDILQASILRERCKAVDDFLSVYISAELEKMTKGGNGNG